MSLPDEWGRDFRNDCPYCVPMKIQQLLSALKHLPCEDCGRTYVPSAMEFDHDPAYEKLFNISKRRTRSFIEIAAELEKCSIVCANCHRSRTEQRRLLSAGSGGPRLQTLSESISTALQGQDRGLTVSEIQQVIGAKDDRRLREALRMFFVLVPETGTHRTHNPARYRAPVT